MLEDLTITLRIKLSSILAKNGKRQIGRLDDRVHPGTGVYIWWCLGGIHCDIEGPKINKQNHILLIIK